MERLIELHRKKLQNVNLNFIRGDMDTVLWEARLVGIKGARGIGKTTLLLQYAKQHLDPETSLYVSLDNIWFTENKLVDLADRFAKFGGTYLLIDEVHKYPNWSQEIKNIYDDYPELKVVFTGSSLLEILNRRADLSRRAITYTMQGLSFREYLNMTLGLDLPAFPLNDILKKHVEIAADVVQKVKPIKYFETYLRKGYYPFFNEMDSAYHTRIQETVNMIIELELPLLRGVEMAYTNKLKQLLFIIAQAVPFIPNITKLSERIGVNRNTLLTYLNYMSQAGLTKSIFKSAQGIGILQKPDKLFLDNPNLMHALSMEKPDIGNLRETFFVNQLSKDNKLEFTDKGDFLVNKKLTFEVGGKNKTTQQIKAVKNAFVAADNLEYGHHNTIPLWLFGFLY
ncbi:MAG: AAA family ATPase [Prevotellaceae bacterium]|jgi:predicted AAA+ superfamily ATPase|nr:AAA family ATPase [Prevotellaceae bacterium]